MYYRLARRAMRYYIFIIIGLAIVAAILGNSDLRTRVFGSPACDREVTFNEEVPEALRAEILDLRARELLYCQEIREGLDFVDPWAYWASDGMSSLLFFQAAPGMRLERFGVGSYLFSDGQNDMFPSRYGDRRPDFFLQVDEGRRAWVNEVPGDTPPYYLRRDGAPPTAVGAVMVSISGPLSPDQGVTNRNFLKDLERGWGWLRGRTGGTDSAGRGARDLNFLIDEDLWEGMVQREVNPALADAQGHPDLARLSREPLPEPALLQRVQGLRGSAVWVAGVDKDRPAILALEPTGGGPAVEPVASQVWTPLERGSALAHFAFPRQPSGPSFTGQYWADRADRECGAAPDKTFALAFREPEALSPTATASP